MGDIEFTDRLLIRIEGWTRNVEPGGGRIVAVTHRPCFSHVLIRKRRDVDRHIRQCSD